MTQKGAFSEREAAAEFEQLLTAAMREDAKRTQDIAAVMFVFGAGYFAGLRGQPPPTDEERAKMVAEFVSLFEESTRTGRLLFDVIEERIGGMH